MFIKTTHIIVMLIISLFAAEAILGQVDTKENPSKSDIQNKIDKKVKKPASTINDKTSVNDDDKKPVIRRRIVDAKILQKRRSPIGSFLLKPFRAAAPAVTARITQFEENKEYSILFGPKTFPINPQFGGVTEGSGIGVGFIASTKDYLSKDFRIIGSALITSKNYIRNTIGIEITPQRFAENKFRIRLIGEQLVLPSQHFFGTGINSSKDNETTFFHRKVSAKLSADFQINKHIKFGAFSEFSRNDISEGSDSDEAVISEVFNSQTLPGLSRNIRLLDSGIFIEAQDTDHPDNPRSGWFTKVTFSNVDSLGRNNSGWLNYKIDSSVYLPIGSKLRVLALRLRGDFNDLKGNSSLPFFRFARLGNSETLRGYEIDRFQGVNALHLNVEYRFRLMQGFETSGFTGVEGVFFGDFGQVFDRHEELKLNNIRGTWGGGLRFTTKKSVGFTLLYAQSPEGGRIIWSFGKTF